MVGITQRCIDFIVKMAGSINELLTNPAIPKSEANAAAAEGMVRALKDPTIRQRIASYIRNSYLSALSTHVVNFVNNLTQVVAAPIKRTLAGRPGESVAMVQGITEGFLEAFPRFFVGLRRNTEAAINDGYKPTSFDIVRNAKADALLSYPIRLTAALDQSFSAVLERMEFRAMLHRIENKFPDEYFTSRGITREAFVKDLEQVAMKRADGNQGFLRVLETTDPALYQQLQDFAAFNTFRTPLGNSLLDKMGKTVTAAKEQVPELNLVIPFVRTGINVVKEAGGYVPGLGMLRVRQAKIDINDINNQISTLASQETKAREKAANAIFPTQAEKWLAKADSYKTRRQKLEGTKTFKEEQIPEFYAQQVMGAGLMFSAYAMAESGLITGHYSTDPATRNRQMASKIPEMSIKIGDRWVSYNRVEPFSTVFGLVLDTMSALKEGRMKGEDPALGDIAKIVGNNLLNKTFTEGLGNAMLAIQEPERYAESYLVSLTNPIIPAVVNQAARISDGIDREVKDASLANWIKNSLTSRIPLLREDLPARTNLAGQERELTGTWTGIQNVPVNQEAVNSLFNNPYLSVGRMQRKVGGLELDLEQFSEMETRTGQTINQVLTSVASNPGFNALPQSLQAEFVEGLIKDIRTQERLRTLSSLVQDPALRAKFVFKEMQEMGLGSMLEEE